MNVGLKKRFDCVCGPFSRSVSFFTTHAVVIRQLVCFRQHEYMWEVNSLSVTIRRFVFWSWCSGHLLFIMHQRHLPASPNWYCSRCSDINGKGVLGFGAKNNIYLLNVTAASPAVTGKSRCFHSVLCVCKITSIWVLLSAGELSGHTERVSGFAFCSYDGQEHICASTSDDKTVKIWDSEQKILLKEHNVHQVSEYFYCMELCLTHKLF